MSLILLAILVVLVIAGDALAPYPPLKLDLRVRFQPPSREHWFGTDEMGRDVLSRVMSGAKVSLIAAVIVIGLAALVGIPLGLISGYRGGKTDSVIMRVTDIFLGFPAMLLALAVAAALGSGLFKAMVASSLVWWPGYARLARGQVLALKALPLVESARAAGVPDRQVLFRHILGNMTSPLIIKFTMDIGYAILFVSGLGFLGLGAQAPIPEWGTMVADGRTYILNRWWCSGFPGMAITLAIVCFNLLGDALEVVLDPTLSRR
ncbi:MAG: ABC transporter permease [Nitrososphaerales archaeon]